VKTRFDGHAAIVTGAARGVGGRAVELLVDEGARVVAADRRGDELEARFGRFGPAVRRVVADATSTADCERLVAEATEAFGGLDLFFANAGITVRAPLADTSDELWQQVIDADLASVFRAARSAAPALRARGGGAIVANASINALKGNLDLVAYSAAKAGVLGMVRALALELAPDGIRVNAVCPGTIDTPMTDEHLAAVADPEALLEALVRKHPLGRLATADDVARAALFLGSPDAVFVTGVALPVDGGRHVA
jgi:3-oxoacyl-[acyl-carrier protein] reductase